MSRPVCHIVHARALPGRAADAERAVMGVADAIRANPDCLDYRVYRDRADPESFVFWERWISEEAIEAHLRRRYMADYLARCDELFASRSWRSYDEVHRLEEQA